MLSTKSKRYNKEKKLKQIVVTPENYQALQQLGNVGESFNDVITKILEYYKTKQNKAI